MTEQPAVELERVDPDCGGDHPDEVTDTEALAGWTVYKAVDDTDDESTGLDS